MERQRVVLPDDAQVLAVLLEQGVDRRPDPLAEGALGVGVLDDGDEGVLGALGGLVAPEVDLVDGRGIWLVAPAGGG